MEMTMLVLTRREKDRICFPTLGIAIEVTRLTSSRAQLGIIAPRGIRVMREELVAQEGQTFSPTLYESCTGGTGASKVNDQLQQRISEIESSLQAAQADLECGQTQSALSRLTQGLAELDQLKSLQAKLDGSPTDWTLPMEVSEPESSFEITNPSRPATQDVLWVDSDPTSTTAAVKDLTDQGFHVRIAEPGLAVLYELSRQNPPDVVVFSGAIEPDQQHATADWIQSCSQCPDVMLQSEDAFRAVAT